MLNKNLILRQMHKSQNIEYELSLILPTRDMPIVAKGETWFSTIYSILILMILFLMSSSAAMADQGWQQEAQTILQGGQQIQQNMQDQGQTLWQNRTQQNQQNQQNWQNWWQNQNQQNQQQHQNWQNWWETRPKQNQGN